MKQLFFFVFCYLLASCGSKVSDNGNTLNIDGAEKKAPSISEIKAVALETNDSVVVGSINKMLVRNDRIYLYDRNNGQFFIFTSEGKHISTINKRGTGPQEYIMPIDMDVDNNGNIYIADAGSRNIIVYDNHGLFIKRIDVGRMFTGIGVVDENNIWLANVSENSNINIKLAYYNVLKKKLNVVSKSRIDNELAIPMVAASPFFRSGEKLMFYDRFTPYCYALGNNGLTCDTIEIVSERIPQTKDIEEWVKKPELMRTTDRISGITALYFADNNLYITFASQHSTNMLYLNNREQIVFDSFNNKRTMHLNQIIYASYGKYLLSYMSAEDFVEKKALFCDEVKKVAKKITPESNPIIIMYSFE